MLSMPQFWTNKNFIDSKKDNFIIFLTFYILRSNFNYLFIYLFLEK